MKFKNILSKEIISLDAEANGLWGQAFSIAAVAMDEEGMETDRFVGRCPIEGETNHWVKENVLPEMEGIPVTHNSYRDLLRDLFGFLAERKSAPVLTHMGHIVEAKLLHDAHDMGIIGDWDAPYLWYDVCLLFNDSVDNYNRENGIVIEDVEGGTHNPLYDCLSAYKAFRHFVENA